MMTTAKIYAIKTTAAIVTPLVMYYGSGIVHNGIEKTLQFLFRVTSENNNEHTAPTGSLHEKIFSSQAASDSYSLVNFLPLVLTSGIALAGICAGCCYRRRVKSRQQPPVIININKDEFCKKN